MTKTSTHAGFSLVELMVSIAVASLLLLAVGSLYSSQAGIYIRQSVRTQVTEEGREVFDVLHRLLRQANASSISVTSSVGNTVIDFTIPAGYPVWPNTTSPYDNNAIRVSWSSNGTFPNQVRIATATSLAGLAAAPMTTLAGSTNGNNTRITNLTLTALASGGYTLMVASGTGNPDIGQVVFNGSVIPRN